MKCQCLACYGQKNHADNRRETRDIKKISKIDEKMSDILIRLHKKSGQKGKRRVPLCQKCYNHLEEMMDIENINEQNVKKYLRQGKKLTSIVRYRLFCIIDFSRIYRKSRM